MEEAGAQVLGEELLHLAGEVLHQPLNLHQVQRRKMTEKNNMEDFNKILFKKIKAVVQRLKCGQLWFQEYSNTVNLTTKL